MPTNTESRLQFNTSIDQLERVVDKLSDNLDKMSDILSVLLQRIAVLEAKLNIIVEKDVRNDHLIEQLRQAIVSIERTAFTEYQKNAQNSNQLSEVKKNFVSKEQFTPIQKIVYGVTAFIMTSIVGAIISQLVLKK